MEIYILNVFKNFILLSIHDILIVGENMKKISKIVIFIMILGCIFLFCVLGIPFFFSRVKEKYTLGLKSMRLAASCPPEPRQGGSVSISSGTFAE